MSLRRLSGVVIQAGVLLWMVSPSLPAVVPVVEVYSGQATVTIVGRVGSFGPKRTEVPSGQRLGQLVAPGWASPAARKPGAAVLADDGSLLMPAVSHNDSLTVPTSPEMAVIVYDPRANTSEVVPLASTPGVAGPTGMLVAPTITGLAPLPGGVVAFTAWAEGNDLAPVFGLLTKVDGHWRLQPGNQWTARALGISRVRGLARLPVSGDLILAQEGGVLTPVRIRPPNRSGHYDVVVRPSYQHPAGDSVIMREVHADPTGKGGAERFVVSMDRTDSLPAIQEFVYEQGKSAITAWSAPLVPGDSSDETKRPYWYQTSIYDHAGNLWAARNEGASSGGLAVYTSGQCKPDAGPWARICPPDYDILQARELQPPQALMEDAAGGTMMLMVHGGLLMPVRAKASGNGLGFELGNLVDIGSELLTTGESSAVDSQPGAIDPDGHLWFPASRAAHDGEGRTTTDRWMFAVSVGQLFDPQPIRLPSVSGRRVTIQAENTVTVSTWQSTTKSGMTIVHSPTHFGQCIDHPIAGCSHDDLPGNGFYLRDESRLGHYQGELAYRVDVPTAGRYRLTYQVCTWPVIQNAKIVMTIGNRKYVTAVNTNGEWRPVRPDVMMWFDAGAQTITIAPPEKDGGGWFLNSMTLQRV